MIHSTNRIKSYTRFRNNLNKKNVEISFAFYQIPIFDVNTRLIVGNRA